MARVLIIGASKGIGLETTRQALEAGHRVRALSRSAVANGLSNPNLEKIRGDALDSRDIDCGARRHGRCYPGSGRLFPGRSFPAGQSLLRRDPPSGQRHGRPGREAADLCHRLWRRRQPRQHQLPATPAVPDGVRPRLCRQVRAGATDQGQFARLDDCPAGGSDERPANRRYRSWTSRRRGGTGSSPVPMSPTSWFDRSRTGPTFARRPCWSTDGHGVGRLPRA